MPAQVVQNESLNSVDVTQFVCDMVAVLRPLLIRVAKEKLDKIPGFPSPLALKNINSLLSEENIRAAFESTEPNPFISIIRSELASHLQRFETDELKTICEKLADGVEKLDGLPVGRKQLKSLSIEFIQLDPRINFFFQNLLASLFDLEKEKIKELIISFIETLLPNNALNFIQRPIINGIKTRVKAEIESRFQPNLLVKLVGSLIKLQNEVKRSSIAVQRNTEAEASVSSNQLQTEQEIVLENADFTSESNESLESVTPSVPAEISSEELQYEQEAEVLIESQLIEEIVDESPLIDSEISFEAEKRHVTETLNRLIADGSLLFEDDKNLLSQQLAQLSQASELKKQEVERQKIAIQEQRKELDSAIGLKDEEITTVSRQINEKTHDIFALVEKKSLQEQERDRLVQIIEEKQKELEAVCGKSEGFADQALSAFGISLSKEDKVSALKKELEDLKKAVEDHDATSCKNSDDKTGLEVEIAALQQQEEALLAEKSKIEQNKTDLQELFYKLDQEVESCEKIVKCNYEEMIARLLISSKIEAIDEYAAFGEQIYGFEVSSLDFLTEILKWNEAGVESVKNKYLSLKQEKEAIEFRKKELETHRGAFTEKYKNNDSVLRSLLRITAKNEEEVVTAAVALPKVIREIDSHIQSADKAIVVFGAASPLIEGDIQRGLSKGVGATNINQQKQFKPLLDALTKSKERLSQLIARRQSEINVLKTVIEGGNFISAIFAVIKLPFIEKKLAREEIVLEKLKALENTVNQRIRTCGDDSALNNKDLADSLKEAMSVAVQNKSRLFVNSKHNDCLEKVVSELSSAAPAA